MAPKREVSKMTLIRVGCGSSRDLCWLKDRGYKVTGFERSKGLAELAGKNAGCEIIEGDFEDYDFSKLNFDAILLCGALVHIAHERFENVFANIIKAIGEAGWILISLKQGDGSITDADGRTFYLWQDTDLRHIFAKHGFSFLEFHRDKRLFCPESLVHAPTLSDLYRASKSPSIGWRNQLVQAPRHHGPLQG